MVKKRKRSPTEVIESIEEPYLEEAFIKLKGGELIPVSEYRHPLRVRFDKSKIKKILKEKGAKNYSELHTHPQTVWLPSSKDLYNFLSNPKAKFSHIAPTYNKKLLGVLTLKKTKKTPRPLPGFLKTILRLSPLDPYTDIFKSSAISEAYHSGDLKAVKKAIKDVADKYHLKYRIRASKNFKVIPEEDLLRSYKNISELEEISPKKENLEKILTSIIGISALTLSLIFLSPTLTGNAIANLTTKTSSIIGGTLFVIGIIGSYFWFKKKN